MAKRPGGGALKAGQQRGSPIHVKKTRFLELLSNSGHIGDSCKGAGFTRNQLREMRKIDKEFSESVITAQQEGILTLEDVAMKRARKSSDILMMFMMKGWAPHRYRERLPGSSADTPIHISISGGLPEEET